MGLSGCQSVEAGAGGLWRGLATWIVLCTLSAQVGSACTRYNTQGDEKVQETPNPLRVPDRVALTLSTGGPGIRWRTSFLLC